jgi:hypothetical protein
MLKPSTDEVKVKAAGVLCVGGISELTSTWRSFESGLIGFNTRADAQARSRPRTTALTFATTRSFMTRWTSSAPRPHADT